MAQNKQTVYHGTSAAAAANIRREQHFRESNADNEWLGSGVYFFRYREHASRWIINRSLMPGEIVTAALEYDDRELLDLNDPAQLAALNRTMEALDRRLRDKIAVKPGERFQNARIWCFSCNTYRALYPEIGMILYTFPQKRIPGASRFPNNETQICVSRHGLITSIE